MRVPPALPTGALEHAAATMRRAPRMAPIRRFFMCSPLMASLARAPGSADAGFPRLPHPTAAQARIWFRKRNLGTDFTHDLSKSHVRRYPQRHQAEVQSAELKREEPSWQQPRSPRQSARPPSAPGSRQRLPPFRLLERSSSLTGTGSLCSCTGSRRPSSGGSAQLMPWCDSRGHIPYRRSLTASS